MAVNPIQFLVAQNASITDGTKTITISGNVDCSRVYSGTAIFLGGADNPAEAVSGTSPDGSGNSTITLRNNWSQGDIVNQQLVSFNTNEGLAEAISNVREIVSNVSAIEDLATQGLIKRIDDNTYEVVNISSQGESLITANDASSQRSVMGLGSAATKDVGTSSGNIMEVGSFGLGGTGKFISLTDWHQLGEYETGFYTSFQSAQNSVNNSPPITTSNTNYTIFVQRDGVRVKITAYASKGVQAFTKTYTGSAWTDWFENYDSGNSVNPLDYGIGVDITYANAPTIANANTQPATGLFRTDGGEVGLPVSSGIGSLINLDRSAGESKNQIYLRGNEADNTGQLFFRGGDPSTSFTNWFEVYHSGNSVNPLSYGLSLVTNNGMRDAAGSIINDLNLSSQPNQFFVFDSATANRPITNQGLTIPNGVGITMSRDANIWGQLTISRAGATLGETVIRAKDGTNIKERTVFDSGNTNFNEFGGSVDDSEFYGHNASPTLSIVYQALNSKTAPTGISVVGTWSLVRYNGNIIRSGITSSDISFSGNSGTRLLRVLISNSSSLAEGQSVELRAETSSSKITVNF